MNNWGTYEWSLPFPLSFGKQGEFTVEVESFLNTVKAGESSSILDKQMKIERKIDGIPIRKIYVGNLPKAASNGDLRALFRGFGEIVHASVSKRFRFTPDQAYTFGFVTYKKTDDAAAALSDQTPIFLLGNRLRVAPADSWHQPMPNPDGTIQWISNSYRNNAVREEETGNDGGDEYEDEDTEGAVGGIVFAGVPESEVRESPISKLNDDCLWNIFDYLEIEDRIEASKVCRRWHTVVTNMIRPITCLDFTHPEWEERTFLITSLEPQKLDELLTYLGPNLTEVNLTVRQNYHVNGGALISIARHCPKLEKLKMQNINLARRSLVFLARQCPGLKHLSFTRCSKLNDSDVRSLLDRCQNLETLELTHMMNIRGNCLTSLKKPLNTLKLDDCNNIIPDLLILGLSEVAETLRRLSLKSCITLRNQDVKKITWAVPHLEFLNLSRFFPYFTECSLLPICCMKELKTLDLTLNCTVNDAVLDALIDGCLQLEELHISGCGGSVSSSTLSQEGVARIGNMPALKELSLCYLEQTTDSSIKQLAKNNPHLKKLNCRSCPNLGDAGCASVLNICYRLEGLDLSGCSRVTEATVRMAGECIKQRTNDVQLKLTVGGTNVPYQDTNVGPLCPLIVDYSDNCIMHLPLECIDDIYFHTDSDDEELSDICDGLDCNCCLPFEDEDDDEYDVNWSPFQLREIEFYS